MRCCNPVALPFVLPVPMRSVQAGRRGFTPPGWTNLKTGYGAKGDGVTDDTAP
jgi:hypothetical protein